jgi:hypothetical protein
VIIREVVDDALDSVLAEILRIEVEEEAHRASRLLEVGPEFRLMQSASQAADRCFPQRGRSTQNTQKTQNSVFLWFLKKEFLRVPRFLR